jgi:hypothetical protein
MHAVSGEEQESLRSPQQKKVPQEFCGTLTYGIPPKLLLGTCIQRG